MSKTGGTTLNAGLEDDKMNRKHQSQLDQNKKNAVGFGKGVAHQPNQSPPQSGRTPDGPMGGDLMNFTAMLESMTNILASVRYISENDLSAIPLDSADPSGAECGPIEDGDLGGVPGGGIGMGGTAVNEEELLNELNQIFTPILVMQGIEGDITDRVMEACSEDNILVERNIIQFDDSTRMAQLIMVCAILLQRQKNTEKYQMYKKAAEIVKATKIDMQKEEYSAASALAQKFLVKVSTTNNSSVARQSAQGLLPQTNHLGEASAYQTQKAKDKESGAFLGTTSYQAQKEKDKRDGSYIETDKERKKREEDEKKKS